MGWAIRLLAARFAAAKTLQSKERPFENVPYETAAEGVEYAIVGNVG